MEITLPPSHANVWGRCAGAPTLWQHVPKTESQDAKDGTAAHWVAATILRAYKQVGAGIPLGADFVGKADPKGTVIQQWMYDAAMVYVMDVLDFCGQHGCLQDLHIEESMISSGISQAVKGPADCWVYVKGMIVIWDFKSGHRYVDPTWAYQFVCYLDAIIQLHKIDGHLDQRLNVEFRVVMPRCHTTSDPVVSFAFKASDARAHIMSLRNQAQLALGPDPQLFAGKHCLDCRSPHICPLARKVDLIAVDYMETAIPDKLTAEGISFELNLLRWLEKISDARMDALEAEAAARIARGEFIPGFLLESGLGKRRFVQDATLIIDNTKMLWGVDLSETAKPCTPSEAERRFKAAGYPIEAIPTTDRPSLPPKLVAADDSKAKLLFNRGEH